MKFANLHNHSTFSDGVYTPEELAELAKKLGYKAIALTDHDNADGTYFMKKAARLNGLYCITGTELEADGFDTDFHIVGLDFNPMHKDFREVSGYLSLKQKLRTEYLFNKAVKNGGLSGITFKDVVDDNPCNSYICNNHIWRFAVKKGLWKSKDYGKFLNAYFKWDPDEEKIIQKAIKMPPLQVETIIKAIINAGGIAVWAHPRERDLKHIEKLLKMGIKGIELSYPINETANGYTRIKVKELIKQYNLYSSGGSDHKGIMGGFEEFFPDHKLYEEIGVGEEEFMEIYYRKKG